MLLEPGTTFDRYVVQELLGEGGMGRVYRAFDDRLRRRVALKILGRPAIFGAAPAPSPSPSPSPSSPSSAPSPSASTPQAGPSSPTARLRSTPGRTDDRVSQILREARAAAALDHPNVVAIFDLGEHEGTPFIAMELVVGRSLRSLVGNKEVSLERRVGWLCDIAKALSAAHRAGVVHRDIKPENVMVREDSVVKVLDFGVARHAAVDLDAPGISPAAETLEATGTSGRLAGTPAYMAPEQVRGKAVDGRTDQFAWGIVAYELLTGKLPWSKIGSVVDVITCVVNEQPPPLRELVPEIPEAIEAVVMRALSKPREARFPTMGELLDALAPGMAVAQ